MCIALLHMEQAGCAACNERGDDINDTCDKGNTAVQLDVASVYMLLSSETACHDVHSCCRYGACSKGTACRPYPVRTAPLPPQPMLD